LAALLAAGFLAEASYVEGRVLAMLVPSGFFLLALAVAVFGAWKLLGTRRLLTERHEERKDPGGEEPSN
jgi:hypothetical protein